MQYYTILSVLAGAAAVSAGLTDSLIPSSLTGSATGDADAKGALSGLPTDDLLSSGLTGDLTGDAATAPEPFTDAATDASTAADAAAPADAKDALSILDGLGLKQMLQPKGYPYEDPAKTTYYQAKPTPTFVTRTVTEDRYVPTTTIIPVKPTDTPTNNSGVESCSEGTATSCCDTNAASDGLLSNILGGSCALSNLQIPVLAVGALGGSQCNNGNTFCCPINQDGNLNIALACIPLNL